MTQPLFAQSWGIWVPGTPVPQGSMTCVGGRGKIRHNIQSSNKAELHPWRDKVTAAALTIWPDLRDYTGPVRVEITFTVTRPATAPAGRVWPHVRSGGDVDKLARAVLDALSPRKGPRTLADDAVVVQLVARKVYPDTPDVPDRRDKAGALIRIYPL